MCLEDYQIWRQLRTNIYTGDSGNNRALDIPANPSRVSIRIVADDGTQVALVGLGVKSQTDPTIIRPILGIAAYDFIPVSQPLVWPVVDIRLQDVGEVLLGPLQLLTSGSTSYCIETYLPIETGSSIDVARLGKTTGSK